MTRRAMAIRFTEPQAEVVGWAMGALEDHARCEDADFEPGDVLWTPQISKLVLHSEGAALDLIYRLEVQAAELDHEFAGSRQQAAGWVRAGRNAADKVRKALEEAR